MALKTVSSTSVPSPARLADQHAHSEWLVIEKTAPNAPILNTKAGGLADDGRIPLLKRFTGLHSDRICTILGPRRVPRIACPAQNNDHSIAICTSVGFRTLEAEEYYEAAQEMRPDVLVSIADIVDAEQISVKRRGRMVDRTHAWFTRAVQETPDAQDLFATVLPLDNVEQQLYLSNLADAEVTDDAVKGLTVYDPTTVAVLPSNLTRHTRLCVTDPATPQEILRAVSMGVDLITTPFVTAITERGIAFAFSVPTSPLPHNQPLGIDMWSPDHATSVTSITAGCKCYTCTRHHRAYIHHLLQAKEMLAWTLLQIHNFHVLDEFFGGIRNSLTAGTFEDDVARFCEKYEDTFAVSEGAERGPRLRGYQMKSAGKGEDKKKEKVWGRFEDSSAAESGISTPGATVPDNDQAEKVVEAASDGLGANGGKGSDLDQTADELEKLGLAEKAAS